MKALLFTLGFAISSHGAIIQAGMFLEIRVKGDDFLTQQVQVKNDGTIDYPLYQDSPVMGITTRELQDILTLKLASYSDAPFVLVTILSALPITVNVMGQVKKSGPVKVSPQSSLQEILEFSGGVTEFADLSRIKVVGLGESDESASYYDLQEFLTTGNLTLLPRLKNGDQIIVLSSGKNNKVKILGAVQTPGFYTPRDSSTLFDMIYLAGGPDEDADLTRVRVLSQEGDKQSDAVINLRKYIDKGKISEIPKVEPGDVVILTRKGFTWSKSLTVVRDIVTLVTAWFVISQLFK